MIAETLDRTQKRMVTLVSGQPWASKWWWRGEDKKTFSPQYFLERIWMTVDSASMTNTKPIIGSSNIELVKNATMASSTPSPIEPVSPIINLAGKTLNHKNANRLPQITIISAAKLSFPSK